jgi:hypothetical protein
MAFHRISFAFLIKSYFITPKKHTRDIRASERFLDDLKKFALKPAASEARKRNRALTEYFFELISIRHRSLRDPSSIPAFSAVLPYYTLGFTASNGSIFTSLVAANHAAATFFLEPRTRNTSTSTAHANHHFDSTRLP